MSNENETVDNSSEQIMPESKKKGLAAMSNDSISKTFIVALLLCLVCSIIVSAAATALKPRQLNNRLLDLQKNILSVAGLTDESQSIEKRFENVESRLVDLESGEYTTEIDVEKYNQRKASKDLDQSIALSSEQDIASISRRAKVGKIYLVKSNDGIVTKVIIPIKGYGLWSTMYGFVALKTDGKTIEDVTFYEHNETPGLGGEIQNRSWQQGWQGKLIYDEEGKPAFAVAKGQAAQDAKYEVDGLAGATITSAGVTNLVRFWVGENGFGPFLKKFAENAGVK